MPRAKEGEIEAELIEFDMPPKRGIRALGKEAQAIAALEVSKRDCAYFKRPETVDYAKFSARIGSHIASVRRHHPDRSFAKRTLEFEDEDGVGVWRTK